MRMLLLLLFGDGLTAVILPMLAFRILSLLGIALAPGMLVSSSFDARKLVPFVGLSPARDRPLPLAVEEKIPLALMRAREAGEELCSNAPIILCGSSSSDPSSDRKGARSGSITLSWWNTGRAAPLPLPAPELLCWKGPHSSMPCLNPRSC